MWRHVHAGLGASVPGELLRFQIVFFLTSSTNASYLHVSSMKVGLVEHLWFFAPPASLRL
jgi:hypothetical protein